MGKQWDKGNYCDIIPDILFGVNLKDCCYKHDVNYWKKPIKRKLADLRLKICIKRKFREKGKFRIGDTTAEIIYITLRLFGWIKWKG